MEDQSKFDQKGSNNLSRLKIIKISLGVFLAIIIIFLGIEFIPGFFGNNKPHRQESSINLTKSNSAPKTTDQTNNSPSSSQPTSSVLIDQFTVKSASILKLDTAVESAHFTIYCHQLDEAKAKELLAISEKDFPLITKYFAQTPKTEILLTYNADEYVNDFTAAPPWAAESYKDPGSSAGSFCPGCTKSLGESTEYVYMLRPQNRSFAHELAHRYFWTNYPNLSKNDSLTWLNEGQSVFIQTEISPGPGGLSDNLNKINDSPLPDSFAILNQLQQKGDYSSTERFYDLAGLIAYYLDIKTNHNLSSFITDLNKTENLDQTSQSLLGITSDQLFNQWRETVSKNRGSNPADFLTNYKSLTSE